MQAARGGARCWGLGPGGVDCGGEPSSPTANRWRAGVLLGTSKHVTVQGKWQALINVCLVID